MAVRGDPADAGRKAAAASLPDGGRRGGGAGPDRRAERERQPDDVRRLGW